MRVGCVTVCLLTGRRKRAGVRFFFFKPGNETKLRNTCRLPRRGFVASVVSAAAALFCVTHTHTHLGFRFKCTPNVKMSRVFPP